MFRIYLLGPPHFTVDSERYSLRVLPKGIPLLAQLIVHSGSRLPRESLAFTLWPDDDEEGALGKLRRHLHDLNKALPPCEHPDGWIRSDRDAVQWNGAAKAWSDLEAFETLRLEAQTQAAAVELYRGELVEGYYDEWILIERERLRTVVTSTLEALVERASNDLAYADAIRYARRLLVHEPWREDVLRMLMTLQYESGDRSGALHSYAQFAQALHEQMDAAVMPETTAIRDRVLANEPLTYARTTPGASGAPEAVLPLLGRDAQRKQLHAAWQSAARGAGTLCVIAGEAGIGKTRLLDELLRLGRKNGAHVLLAQSTNPETAPYAPIDAALAHIDHFVQSDDRQRFIERRRSTSDSVELFEAYAEIFRALARRRPLILAIEDVHWSGDATLQLIQYVARACSELPVLFAVTLRDVEGAENHSLRAFRGGLLGVRSQQIVLGRLTCDEIESIAGSRARAESLFAGSGGHPLYLTEMIGNAETVRSESLARLYVDRFKGLPSDAAALAEIAAVHAAPVDIDLVSEVAGWRYDRVIDATAQLLQARFMHEVRGSGAFAYAFTHDLVRSTIYEALDPTVRRHRHAIVATALARSPQAMPPVLAYHYENAGMHGLAVESYIETARMAAARFAHGDARAALDRADTLDPSDSHIVEIERLRHEIASARGERDVEAAAIARLEGIVAQSSDPRARFDAASRRSSYERVCGNREAQKRAVEEARRWARLESTLEPDASFLSGLLLYDESNFVEASKALEEAARGFEGAMRLAHAAEAVNALVENAVARGDFETALSALTRATKLSRDAANGRVSVRTLTAASNLMIWRQEYARALEFASASLELAEETGDRFMQASAHERLAIVNTRLRRYREAQPHYERARAIFDEIGSPKRVAGAMLNAAILWWRMGYFRQARDSVEAAKALFARLDDARGGLVARLNLCMVDLSVGDPHSAILHAREAVEIAEALGTVAYRVQALTNLGAALRDAGQVTDGAAQIEAGIVLAQRAGLQPSDLATEYADAALAHRAAGDRVRAHARAEDAIAALQGAQDSVPFPHFIYWCAARAYDDRPSESARFTGLAASELQRAFVEAGEQMEESSLWSFAFNREIAEAAHLAVGRCPDGLGVP